MALTNATTLADYGSGIGTQGATLKVDANNQRVGIGTLTPAETLDVVGNMAVEGDISVTGTISYEDVTNVDSVGLGTFRNGLHVTGGSVGIGTTNPINKFHATQYTANTDVATFQIGSASAYTGFVNCRVGTTGSGSFIGGLYTPDGSLEGLQGTNGLIFSTSGSNLERLRITSAGLVGINSASPISRLDINAGSVTGLSAGTITNVLSITESGSQSGTGQRILFKNVQQNWEQGAITALREGGADSFSLTLSSSNGGTNAEALRITSSGNVGIGTTNPQYKLNVTSQLGCTYSGALRHLVNIDSNGGKSYWYNGTPTNTAYILGDSGNAYFAGNVGIGTDNPTKILHLSQNSDIAIRMHAGNANVNARSWEITVGGNPSNNTEMVFRTRGDDGTGGSECARITRSGVIKLPSGGGIDFSATSDAGGMTSELLDDYEEGTWTPVLYRTSVNPTVTYTTNRQKGRYTKIGNVVTIWFDVDWSSLTGGSGDPILGGLPYTVVAGADQGGYGAPQFRDATGVSVDFRIYGSSSYFSGPSYINLRHYNSSGTELATTFNSSGRLTVGSVFHE
jgi:hypothetical protein